MVELSTLLNLFIIDAVLMVWMSIILFFIYLKLLMQ